MQICECVIRVCSSMFKMYGFTPPEYTLLYLRLQHQPNPKSSSKTLEYVAVRNRLAQKSDLFNLG